MNKKLLSIVLTSILFMSCGGADLFLEMPPYYWDYPGLSVSEIAELKEATAHLVYIPDGDEDHWRLPDYTWDRDGGDCEDLSSTSAYILKYEMGLNAKLAVLKLKSRDEYHMVVSVDGVLYEYDGRLINMDYWELRYTISFDEYVKRTYTTKRSVYQESIGGYDPTKGDL